MRDEQTYWNRLTQRRHSRRTVLGAAAAGGVGAVGLAAVGCGDDDDDDDTGADPTATSGGSSGDPTQAADPTESAGGPVAGGALLRAGSSQVFDTYDMNRTQFSTILAFTNPAYEKVVHWGSYEGGPQAAGGLAESWEQPDLTTITFKVRDGAMWHDKPPVDGRETNAEDIAFHINRNRAGTLLDGTVDPNFYRQAAYDSAVDTVEVVDDKTVRVNFKQPAPRFLNLLAQAFELVQAPEAVEAFEAEYNAEFGPTHLIGSGPFRIDEVDDLGNYTMRRHDGYHGTVWLDGIKGVATSGDSAANQVAFEQRQIDSFNPPTPQLYDDLKGRFGDNVRESAVFSALGVGGYYNGGAPPWNNPNLIGGIFRALDRRLLIQQLYGGRGVLSGQVLPIHTGFNLSLDELETFPGYLPDVDEDIAEARKMWEAGGGPDLGEVSVDMADLWVNCCGPNGPEVVQSMLNNNLGVDQFKVSLDTYPNMLGTKFAGGQYGNGNAAFSFMGNIPQANDPDPTDQLIQFFRTDQPQAASFGTNIAGLDDLLYAADVELDNEARQEMIKEVERLLLQNYGGGIINTMSTFSQSLIWNYIKASRDWETSPFGTDHFMLPTQWIDTNDPSYSGRASANL